MSKLGAALGWKYDHAPGISTKGDVLIEFPGGILTQAEQDACVAEYEEATKWDEVRAIRNELITATDWRFLSDQTPSQSWIDYRQALRDITTFAAPGDVVWPVEPMT
jgi:hypothetical protein